MVKLQHVIYVHTYVVSYMAQLHTYVARIEVCYVQYFAKKLCSTFANVHEWLTTLRE